MRYKIFHQSSADGITTVDPTNILLTKASATVMESSGTSATEPVTSEEKNTGATADGSTSTGPTTMGPKTTAEEGNKK